MNWESALECARPLIFESDVQSDPAAGFDGDDFRYFVGATCFLCRWRGKPFIVTVEHAIRHVKNENIYVFARSEDKVALDYSTIWKTEDPSETELTDIAILEIRETDENRKALRNACVLDLSSSVAPSPRYAKHIVVAGYPNQERVVDYNRRKIPEQRFRLSANYLGETAPYLSHVEIAKETGLRSYDGFSGSPVFAIERSQAAFLGMILRGSQDTGVS